MTDDKRKGEFVPLSSLRPGRRDPKDILAEIRTIYFKTSRKTILRDLDHAIALLKMLPTEEDQEKAAVYMDGLSQMRSEWARGKKR
jgi:hypothetical protein